MRLKPGPFDAIRDGRKTIEIRLLDEKRQELKIGDIIEFNKEPDRTETIRVVISALHVHPNLGELIGAYPIEEFGYQNPVALLADLNKYFPIERQREFNALGIELRMIDTS